MLEIFIILSILFVVVGSIALVCDEEVVSVDFLTEPKEWGKFIFMFPYAVYFYLKDDIKIGGIIILMILVTAFTFYTIPIYTGLVLIIGASKVLWKIFYMIFRKDKQDG